MSDPVADFIAREQDMLAELDDSPAHGVPPVPNAADPQPNAYDLADEFAALAAPPADPVSIGGGDSGVDLTALDSVPPAPFVNGGAGLLNGGGSKGPSPVPSVPRMEAEKIRKWREQQQEMLQKKDEAEEKKRAELREQGRKELADWYAQRDATLNAAREANRKTEQDHLAAFAKQQGEGAQWDEVARLCGEKTVKGGKDISRLKSLLLHLKEHDKK